MNESLEYRTFESSDIDQLQDCIHAFETYYAQKGSRAPRGEDFSRNMAEVTIQRVEKESGVIWCAWAGDRMVGFCVGVVEESGAYDVVAEGVHHMYGKITDMYVRDEMRGKHVGSQLIHHTEQTLQEKDVTKIHLEVIVDNGEVVSFYEKNGYKKESIILAKSM